MYYTILPNRSWDIYVFVLQIVIFWYNMCFKFLELALIERADIWYVFVFELNFNIINGPKYVLSDYYVAI